MIIKGKAWKLGDNIDTDMILPGKYLSLSNPSLLGEHCLEGIAEGWADKISPGDILVAGKNFGCGSSREHAPIALKAAGISCVVAESFGAIFYRNAINVGVPVIELESVSNKFEEGDILETDIKTGKVKNVTAGKTYDLSPMASIIIDILESGGLLNYIAKRSREFSGFGQSKTTA